MGGACSPFCTTICEIYVSVDRVPVTIRYFYRFLNFRRYANISYGIQAETCKRVSVERGAYSVLFK